MQAIDLFGGREVVINRMSDVLRKKVKKLPPAEAAILEEAFRLKKNTIRKLKQKDAKSDMELFDRLSVPLRIPLQKAFGDPQWDENTKKAWEQHKQQNWVSTRRTSRPGLPSPDISVETYVVLKAASELRQKPKHSN